MNIQKPWIGTDGKILSDDELKAICKNWSAAIWEQYLTSIEKKPRQEDEVLVGDPGKLEASVCGFASLSASSDHISDQLMDDCRDAIAELPTRQKHVIEEEIYLDKGQRVIASEMGVSRTPIRKLRQAAHKKLREKLSKYRP